MEDITDYIRKSFAKGLKKDQVEANLLHGSWTKEQIDEAFYQVEYSQKEFIELHRKRLLPSKKVLEFLIILLLLSTFIYHFYLYLDIKNGCFVKIIPSINQILSVKRFKRDIKIIKFGSPEDYQNICKLISTIDTNTYINCANLPSRYSCYVPKSKTISLSTEAGAYTMVHEVCHAIQDAEGRSFDESECRMTEYRLSRQLLEI